MKTSVSTSDRTRWTIRFDNLAQLQHARALLLALRRNAGTTAGSCLVQVTERYIRDRLGDSCITAVLAIAELTAPAASAPEAQGLRR